LKGLIMKSFTRNSPFLLLVSVGLALVLTSTTAKGATIADDGPPNIGDVLIGPCGVPGAMGPAGVNDDFTNRSVSTGIDNVPPGGATTAPGSIVFRNTIQNIGAGDDVFLISAPTAPAGFGVEISTDNGDHYTRLETATAVVTLAVSYRAAAIMLVRIKAPAGLKILTGFDTVIRATSTATGSAANETIDRLYTGFIRLDKSAMVVNATGASLPATAAPGAEIEFAVTYSNVSSAVGVGNSLLTAYNLVINENGNSAPNNWGATTEHIVGASDTQGGHIIGDLDGSTSLTDIVSTLEAGQSGIFKFKRRVK
jgi:hypothetical protein